MIALDSGMKTQMQKIRNVVFILIASIGMWSCSQKSSGGTAAAVVANTGYVLNAQGICVNTATGQQAPNNTYCTTTNNGYLLNAQGICVNQATGVQAPNQSYCQQTAAGVGQVCSGYYTYQPPGSAPQQGFCDTNTGNCRGYTLINSSGQSVLCQ